MERTKLWLIILVLCGCPLVLAQSISSHCQGDNGSGVNLTVTTGTCTVASGDLLIASVVDAHTVSPPIPIISDTSGGNGWRFAGQTVFGTTSTVSYWYVLGAKPGSYTVTATFGVGETAMITVADYGSMSKGYTLDLASFGTVTTSSPVSASITTTNSSDFIVSVGVHDTVNTGSWGASGGWNSDFNVSGSSNFQFAFYSQTGGINTYTNSIANSGTIRSLHEGILAFKITTPASGWLQECQGFTASGTSVSCSLPFTSTANDTWMVAIQTNGFYPPTSVSGCSLTFHAISNTPDNKINVYYAAGVAATAPCAITATSTGNTAAYNIMVDEYTGLVNPYSLDTSVNAGLTNTPVTSALTVTSANEILYLAAGIDWQTSTVTSITSSGYSGRGVNNQNSATSGPVLGILDTLSSSGSNTTSVSWNGTNGNANNSTILVALRVALPTIGQVQTSQNSCSSVLTCSASFNYNVAAGDGYIASIYWTGSTSCYPTISSNVSDTFNIANVLYLSNDLSAHHAIYYVSNAVGGATTVTAQNSGGGCSQSYDIFLTEMHGTAHSTPLFNATASPSSGTTLSMGPIPNTTGMYIYSDAGGAIGYSHLWTVSSGFVTRAPWITNFPAFNNIGATWDQVSASSSVSNTVVNSNAGQSAWGSLLAFSATNNTFDRVLQITSNGNGTVGTSISQPTLISVKAGDTGVVFAQYVGSSSTALPISDSQGNTWRSLEGCTLSSLYCLAYTTLSSSGIDTITVNPNNGSAFHFLEIPPSVLDGHNSGATASGVSQGTGSITTTKLSDIVITFCTTPTSPTLFGPSTPPTNSVFRSYVSAHFGAVGAAYDLNQAPPASYSGTCTATSSTALVGAIVAFGPSSSSSVNLPPINVMSKLYLPFARVN